MTKDQKSDSSGLTDKCALWDTDPQTESTLGRFCEKQLYCKYTKVLSFMFSKIWTNKLAYFQQLLKWRRFLLLMGICSLILDNFLLFWYIICFFLFFKHLFVVDYFLLEGTYHHRAFPLYLPIILNFFYCALTTLIFVLHLDGIFEERGYNKIV